MNANKRLQQFTQVLMGMAVMAMTATPAAYAGNPDDDLMKWNRGPAQFLMTSAEKGQWATVHNEEQARHFIDLFWARRDPTPDTTRNENREEFDRRVAYADARYKDRRGRGALSDRGRVFIILGPPTNNSAVNGSVNAIAGGEQAAAGLPVVANTGLTSGGGSGGALNLHQGTNREEWQYDERDAHNLGVARSFSVVFVELSNGIYQRDTQRGFGEGAIANAMNRMIVNPGLTEVPRIAVGVGSRKSIVQTETYVQDGKKVTVALLPTAPVAVKGDPGAHNVLLASDVARLPLAQSTGDPFASAKSEVSFRRDSDLAYAFEYCGTTYDPAASAPELRVEVMIKGKEEKGSPVEFDGGSVDSPTEAIKSRPGCYMVRAAMPLADIQRGQYELALTVHDSEKTYTLNHPFNVN
jgi:GWxTD domain-containing protein